MPAPKEKKPAGGSKASKPKGQTRDKKIHNAGRTLLHDSMKSNAENKFTRSGVAESLSQVASRYKDSASFDRKTARAGEDRAIRDAEAIRKNRVNTAKKSSGGGSGSSRSDAVKKAWITRKKNKG